MSQLTDSQVATIIRKGADLLEKSRWRQHSFGNPSDGMCSLGAIRWAHGWRPTLTYQPFNYESDLAEGRFAKWLYGAGFISQQECEFALGAPFPSVSAVGAWNDREDQTQEEVVRVMRKFADEIDPQVP